MLQLVMEKPEARFGNKLFEGAANLLYRARTRRWGRCYSEEAMLRIRGACDADRRKNGEMTLGEACVLYERVCGK